MPKNNNRPSTNTQGASADFWAKHSISSDQKPSPRVARPIYPDNTRVTPEDIAPFRGPVSLRSATDNTRVTPRAKEYEEPLKRMEQKVEPTKEYEAEPIKKKVKKEYVEPQEQLEPEYDERKETLYHKETNVFQRTADRIVDPLRFAKSNLEYSAIKARNAMDKAADRVTDPLVNLSDQTDRAIFHTYDKAVKIVDRFKKK